jgi:hypothetical protein
MYGPKTIQQLQTWKILEETSFTTSWKHFSKIYLLGVFIRNYPIVVFPIYLCGSFPCTRSRPDLNIWFTRLTGPLVFCGAKCGFSPVHSRGLAISRCDWAILKWSLFFFWFTVGLPYVLLYFLTLQCHSAECAWAVFNPGPNPRSQKFRMDHGHLPG